MGLQVTILFFDGLCRFCDATVNYLISKDPGARLRFAPLQGETARTRLPPELLVDLDTAVLIDAEGIHLRSTAVLRAVRALGGWRGLLASLALLVPGPLRDFFYRRFARRRYRWFGKRETCRLPTPEERSRFLD